MTDIATLRSLEERLLASSIRKEAAIVATMLAEEFREFGSSGRVYNKIEILAELAAELPKQIQLHDFECCFPAADVALITYRTESQTQSALRSSLWIRRDNRWQMLFHQGTRCDPPS